MDMKHKCRAVVWAFLLLGCLAMSAKAQKECISDAPVTFEDSTMLQHVESCIATPDKYAITYQ